MTITNTTTPVADLFPAPVPTADSVAAARSHRERELLRAARLGIGLRVGVVVAELLGVWLLGYAARESLPPDLDVTVRPPASAAQAQTAVGDRWNLWVFSIGARANFDVAIICIVLVMRRILPTAFIRLLISRALAMGRRV